MCMLKECYKKTYCLSPFNTLFLFDFSREQRDIQGGVGRQGRRLRARTKNEDGEFATGLIIGQRTFLHFPTEQFILKNIGLNLFCYF